MPKKITRDQGRILVQNERWKIMKLLTQENNLYAKIIAEKLNISEQNIHYHLNILHNAGFIKYVGIENVNRGRAKLIKAVDNEFILSIINQKSPLYQDSFARIIANHFSEKNIFSGKIVIGSAQPHGPFNAVARDGYLAGELCWFLGMHFGSHTMEDIVLTDEEIISRKMIYDTNLISIGGHIANTVTLDFNETMKQRYGIYFREHTIMSQKKKYDKPNHGLICLFPSPYNLERRILVLAGVGVKGTDMVIKSVINGFISFDPNIDGFSIVIEGISSTNSSKFHIKVLEQKKYNFK